jgi:hypothetical protein
VAPEVREFIRRSYPDAATEQLLARIPDCPQGEALNVCGRRGTRQPSAYQQFVGQCLREKKVKSFADAPAKLKQCASEWRARKP